MNILMNKNILLGITGSIAAYKAAEITSILKKEGCDVKVVMTKSAHELSIQQSNKSKGENKFLPPTLDIEIKSDTSMVIGGHEFKFYLTPGHTEGDFSLDFTV